MQTAEDIEDLKAERANILGEVQNHCPFGCTKGDLDEYGYCVHLVGFTNDKKTIETIKPWKRMNHVTGEWVETGDKFVSGKKQHRTTVLETDTIINPTKEQIVEGIKTKVSAWVSSRVYREVVVVENPETDIETVTFKEPDPQVKCERCGKSFKNKNSLRTHQNLWCKEHKEELAEVT